ncbi:MAG: GGDEF domain-containing protein [Polyangiaceae bacterium]|nr:GGDEF domain-containing protein [Polyangiaceae bacterium]
MLWKRKKATEESSQVSGAASEQPAGGASEKALDAVSRLLRDYGRFAFDLSSMSSSDIRKECEAWASKIVIGAAHTEDEEPAPAHLKRDWPGLFQFFANVRKEEASYVLQSLEDLRDAVRTFARHVSSAIDHDRSDDKHVREHLRELSTAIDTNDTAKIRLAAEGVIKIVSDSLDARNQRQADQVRELGQKLRELHTELDQAQKRAEIDPLTQLLNRAVFDSRIARLAELGSLFERPPSLLLVDADHFKGINDTFGHPAGDETLRKLADTLVRTFVRKQDLVCRYGGEEFGIVLVETDQKSGEMLGQRLLEAVRKAEIVHAGKPISVTVSVGLAVLQPGESAASWLDRADKALYAAKQAGRDRLEVAAG